MVDERGYHEIITLYAETKRVTMEEEKQIKEAESGRKKEKRVPAGDNWF